jgi:hypothetical protein
VERWIGGHLHAILKQPSRVLEHWSKQKRTSKDRVKSFANWLLVHFVQRVWEARAVVNTDLEDSLPVATNHHLEPRPVVLGGSTFQPPEALRKLLRGGKQDSSSIVTDLSFRPRDKRLAEVLNLEIKTQTETDHRSS